MEDDTTITEDPKPKKPRKPKPIFVGDEPIEKLTKDLREAAKNLAPHEVRYLVDLYYQTQDYRMQAASQVKSMSKSGEPVALADWVFESQHRVESQIKKALDIWTDNEKTGMGRWCKSICGIAEVMAAGLIAHLDIEPWICSHKDAKKHCTSDKPHGPECKFTLMETAGHFWRFAGLDPTSIWEKKTKRPWNAKLKVLCWKLGESFIAFQNNDKDRYGKLYAARYQSEWERNLNGSLSDQASAVLEKKKLSKSTIAYKWYSGQYTFEPVKECIAKFRAGDRPIVYEKDPKTGAMKQRLATLSDMLKEVPRVDEGQGNPMLPPGHIQSRARRWAVKIFLSHLHAEMYRRHTGKEPPAPFPIAILGHAHLIEP